MLRRTSFDGQKLFSLISRNLKVETSQPDLDSSLIEPKTIQGKNLVQPTQVTFYLFVGNYLSIHPQPHTNFANLHAQAPIQRTNPTTPPNNPNKHTLPEQNDFYVGILGSIPRSYYLALFLLLIFIYQECNLIHTHAYIYIYIHIYIFLLFLFDKLKISLSFLYPKFYNTLSNELASWSILLWT